MAKGHIFPVSYWKSIHTIRKWSQTYNERRKLRNGSILGIWNHKSLHLFKAHKHVSSHSISIIIFKEPQLNIVMSATSHSLGLMAGKNCQHKTKSNESWKFKNWNSCMLVGGVWNGRAARKVTWQLPDTGSRKLMSFRSSVAGSLLAKKQGLKINS